MGIQQERLRCQARETLLDFQWRLAVRQPSAVGDTKNMRVHGNRWLAKRGVQDDISGLAANAGQGFERGALARPLAIMVVNQASTRRDTVLGLAIE